MASEAFFSGFTNFLVIIIRFLISAFLARTLTLETMGKYQYYLSFVAFFQFVTLPGMNSAITKGALKGYDTFLFVGIKRAFRTSLIFSVFIVFVAIISSRILSNQDIFIGLLVCSFFIPLQALQKFDSFLLGKKKFFQSRSLTVLNVIFQGSLFYAILTFTKNIFFLLGALFISNLIYVAITYFMSKLFFKNSETDKKIDNSLNEIGIKLSFLQIFNQIVGNLDRIILGTMNPSILAIYHVGSIIPRSIKDNLKIILNVPIMHWGSLSKKENLRNIKKYGFIFFLGGVGVTLGLWVLAEYLILYFYGDKYTSSIMIIRFLSLSIPLKIFSAFIEFENIYQSGGGFYTKQTIIIKTIYLILMLYLVSNYQTLGIVIAYLVSDLLAFTFNMIYLIKKGNFG